MRAEILAVCRRELQPGDHVVCALSGGGDSVALLHCLRSLREELGITLSAAHFNHCLRGEESDGDEAFVRELCSQWDVPLVVGRGDPRQLAGKSPEEAARILRYEFLMAQSGIIATAHHADDQMETVLLNLLRGTGLKGLCGMPVRSGRLLRPMLEVPKAAVESYLAKQGLSCRFDSSNGEDDALRNRLRHHILPFFQAENPNFHATFARMTALLQQDEAWLEAQTAELLKNSADKNGYNCVILRNSPENLRSRAIRQLLPIPKPAMAHVEEVEKLLADTTGSASIDLPGGVTAIREYEILRFEKTAPAEGFQATALHPGETVCLPGMTVTLDGPRVCGRQTDDKTVFAIKTDGAAPPAITLRPRQTGDSLRLSGGSKSLKKLMIDRKIPAAQRDLLPVLTDDRGVIAVYKLGCDAARKALPGELAWIIQFHQEERETDAGKDDEENEHAQ